MRLIAVCAAALLGLGLGDVLPLQAGPLAAAAVLSGVAALLAWPQPRSRLIALATCVTAAGALRATVASADHAAANARLTPLYGRTASVHVTVLEPPAVTTSGASARLVCEATPPQLAAEATSMRPDAEGESAPIRLRVVGDLRLMALEPGDRVHLRGKLLPPVARQPPTLIYAVALAPPERAPPTLPTAAAQLRARAQSALLAHLPRPEASLAAGVLLGSSGGLDPSLRAQLQRSGLAHIMAIDGYKQLLLATIVGATAGRLAGARWARVAVLAGVVSYTLLTGAHPSAVRSGLMVGLASLALLSGRPADSLTSLVVATTLMLGIDPLLLFDLGLQLSVSATLGIILLWPRLRRRLHGLPHVLVEPAGLTLTVTVATLPIQLAVFQSVSLVSPLAHVVAVPLLPAVFVSAALLALASPFGPIAAPLVLVATVPARLLVYATAFFGDLPGAAIDTGPLPVPAAILVAVALFGWAAWPLPEVQRFRKATSAQTTSAATPGSPG